MSTLVTNNAVPPVTAYQQVNDATAAKETLQCILSQIKATQKWHEAGKDVSH